MQKIEIQKEITAFVCRNFLVEEHEIVLGESLVDQGIIDSFGLVEIAAFLKKRFSIVTAEGDMNRSNYGSILKMADFVERKLHG